MGEVGAVVLVELSDACLHIRKPLIHFRTQAVDSLVGFTDSLVNFCKSFVHLVRQLRDGKQDIDLCEHEDSHNQGDEGYPEIFLIHRYFPTLSKISSNRVSTSLHGAIVS